MERLLEAVKVIVSGVWSQEPLWKMRFSEGIYKKHQNDQNEINVLLYQVMKCLFTLLQFTGYILFGTTVLHYKLLHKNTRTSQLLYLNF